MWSSTALANSALVPCGSVLVPCLGHLAQDAGKEAGGLVLSLAETPPWLYPQHQEGQSMGNIAGYNFPKASPKK